MAVSKRGPNRFAFFIFSTRLAEQIAAAAVPAGMASGWPRAGARFGGRNLDPSPALIADRRRAYQALWLR
jgi:hypothetical protein